MAPSCARLQGRFLLERPSEHTGAKAVGVDTHGERREAQTTQRRRLLRSFLAWPRPESPAAGPRALTLWPFCLTRQQLPCTDLEEQACPGKRLALPLSHDPVLPPLACLSFLTFATKSRTKTVFRPKMSLQPMCVMVTPCLWKETGRAVRPDLKLSRHLLVCHTAKCVSSDLAGIGDVWAMQEKWRQPRQSLLSSCPCGQLGWQCPPQCGLCSQDPSLASLAPVAPRAAPCPCASLRTGQHTPSWAGL